MKVRTGFVSNSSSSSFIFATKGDVFNDDIAAALNGGVRLKAGTVSYRLCMELVEEMRDGEELVTMKDLVEHVYDEELVTKLAALKADGFRIFYGSASDEDAWDRPLQTWLCYHALAVKSDNFLFFKEEAGY